MGPLDNGFFNSDRLFYFLCLSFFEAMTEFIDVVDKLKYVGFCCLVNRPIFRILDQVVFNFVADLPQLRPHIEFCLETLLGYRINLGQNDVFDLLRLGFELVFSYVSVDASKGLPKRAIKVILYAIVGLSRKKVRDLGPAIPMSVVKFE